MPREIRCHYRDPMDEIWRAVAQRVGLRIARSHEVFAATDGRGTLTLGDPATLDPDDCLAQMIFHELCHSLVQGPESFARADWGLVNVEPGDEVREHACLRVQAHLAGAHGLREVLAPTTDFRASYDELPADPLAGEGLDHELARAALARASQAPWAPHLQEGLLATHRVGLAVAPHASADSLWSRFQSSTRAKTIFK